MVPARTLFREATRNRKVRRMQGLLSLTVWPRGLACIRMMDRKANKKEILNPQPTPQVTLYHSSNQGFILFSKFEVHRRYPLCYSLCRSNFGFHVCRMAVTSTWTSERSSGLRELVNARSPTHCQEPRKRGGTSRCHCPCHCACTRRASRISAGAVTPEGDSQTIANANAALQIGDSAASRACLLQSLLVCSVSCSG